MSDDFVTLKLGVVSDATAEREALRRAASQASVPLVITEFQDMSRAEPVCEWLLRENLDVLVIDSRMPHSERKIVLDAARVASNSPLVVAIARAEGKALDILAEATMVDGLITTPIEPARASALLEGCVRARFSNRVLVVDDSSTVRSVVRKVLQASRFPLEPHEAADGAAAVERATNEHFDIVFLDCHMPGLDGFATLVQLREVRPDVKVVMMTAASDDAVANRARAAGAHHLLHKPFYAKDIDAALNRIFGLVPPHP